MELKLIRNDNMKRVKHVVIQLNAASTLATIPRAPGFFSYFYCIEFM